MLAFADKVLLITGGTGSFGNAVLRRLLPTDIGEVRILSRDEKKQDEQRCARWARSSVIMRIWSRNHGSTFVAA